MLVSLFLFNTLLPPQHQALALSSQGTSHRHPERPSSFICLIPSHPHSVALLLSLFCLWQSLIWGRVVFFSLTSPRCVISVSIYKLTGAITQLYLWYREEEEHENNTWGGGSGFWWFGVGPQCTLTGWRKITFNCYVFCPLDHGMQDITVTSVIDTYLWGQLLEKEKYILEKSYW